MNEKEAVINAVAHRDYFEKGANVMVEMFDDRIQITNFGRLVKGLKPADFGKKSVLRNPNIAGLLHRVKYIEKMGIGINKMRGLMAEAGLPPIVFEFGTFFTAIFRRPARIAPTVFDESGGAFGGVFEAVNDAINDTINEPINEGIKKRLTNELLHIVE